MLRMASAVAAEAGELDALGVLRFVLGGRIVAPSAFRTFHINDRLHVYSTISPFSKLHSPLSRGAHDGTRLPVGPSKGRVPF